VPIKYRKGRRMKRDILSVLDMASDFSELIDLAIKMKKERTSSKYKNALEGRTLGMIFEKPSTRTRVSLEVAMQELGGHAMYLNLNDIHLGKGETVADTARVVSRMLSAIAYRAYRHEDALSFAKNASVPVINALDDIEHPTQALADYMTIKEKKGGFKGIKVSFIGDGNNVAHSLMLGAALLGADFYIASPQGYEPKQEIVEKAKSLAKSSGATINIVHSPEEAARGADVIYTDVWVSMGKEAERENREKAFAKYQVNADLLSRAEPNKDYLFMHCLPAHRGKEVTDEIIDSKNSVVFDQAENRLHTAKALLYTLLSKEDDKKDI